MELMNALFIESLMEEKVRVQKVKLQEAIESREDVKDMMVALFNNYDIDSDGHLDKEELKTCMRIFNDVEIQELLEHVGISHKSMLEALDTADLDASGEVSAEEFRTAIDNVHVKPTRLHLAVLQRYIETKP